MEENNEMEVVLEFPPKPEDVQKQKSLRSSLISLVLFVLFFYFVFDSNVTYIFYVVVVLLIHELGHFLAMKHYDYQNLNIFFIPLIGAAASGQKSQISQKEEVIVLLAGPIPGIVLGTILAGLGHF